jgi:hypothetical protein
MIGSLLYCFEHNKSFFAGPGRACQHTPKIKTAKLICQKMKNPKDV